MLPADVTLTPTTERDFPVLRELAGTIWRQHYAGIISAAQIDYMLAARFSDEALRDHTQAADKWLELLRVSGAPVGYCAYELASMDGNKANPTAMKLGQLYVVESHRGFVPESARFVPVRSAACPIRPCSIPIRHFAHFAHCVGRDPQ